ncbi:hypothetical protein GCM10010372_81020 [Streptomyces tauricus]|nr:hypothetical protein GCM10010372_81020 [Streptomyces tauricus]
MRVPVGELGEDLLRLKTGADGDRARPAAGVGGQPHLRLQLSLFLVVGCHAVSTVTQSDQRLGALDGLAHVVAGGGVPVLGAGWSSWPRPGGFGCTGRTAEARADVSEPTSDAGRGERGAGAGGLLPGLALVGCEREREAELGVGSR